MMETNEAICDAVMHRGLGRPLAIFSAVSLALILAQSIVFASFGLLLFAMSDGLHGSAADIGFAYTLIVIGACVGAAIPVPLMRFTGAGPTIVIGQITLVTAFLLLYGTGTLPQLYLAAILAGIGFSLSANTPGIYLISGWCRAYAARLIGIYMMIGMLGNAIGPPMAQALIVADGWKGYVLVAAGCAAASACFCLLCLRDPPKTEVSRDHGTFFRDFVQIMRSPIFQILAAAVVVSQTSLVTIASVAPAHLADAGVGSDKVAELLGIQGLASAFVTGVLGLVSRFVSARRLLPVALIAGAIGMASLARSDGATELLAVALLTGASVGGVTLAATLLLVDYFGAAQGSAALGAIWTLAGLAALGPLGAGLVADASGGYAPALWGIGGAMLPVALGAFMLPRSALPIGRPARSTAKRQV